MMLRQAGARAGLVRLSFAFGGGCLAFTDDLRRVTWPRKFRPGITFKYDGTTDPREFSKGLFHRHIDRQGGKSTSDGELVPAGAESASK
jgi:hypothetical protein